jgi:hypothetical protein
MSIPDNPAGRSKTPVVEESPIGEPHTGISQRDLNVRIRQQRRLAELGVSALKGTSLTELLDAAAQAIASLGKMPRQVTRSFVFVSCIGK